MKCEDGKFSRTTETERKPATVSAGYISGIFTVTVHPPGILERSDKRFSENTRLKTVGMSCEC